MIGSVKGLAWAVPFVAPVAYYFLWRKVADTTDKMLTRLGPEHRDEPVPNDPTSRAIFPSAPER